MTEPDRELARLIDDALKQHKERELSQTPLTEQEARDRMQEVLKRYLHVNLAQELSQYVSEHNQEERSP